VPWAKETPLLTRDHEETTTPTTHHFLGQITVGGVPRVPQRFAQDWNYVDPVTGSPFAGNATVAKNYLGYGKEIYAVANGTVVDLLDGLPDNELIYSAPPFTVATAAGSYVIIDIGNRKYACYTHMIPGSIRVKKGDVVTDGQVIGLMGNNGNSNLSHLQVVTDSPTFLGAEGYPHIYRSFDVIGGINQTHVEKMTPDPGFTIARLWGESGSLVKFSRKPLQQENRLLENAAIVRLPGPSLFYFYSGSARFFW